MRRSRFAGCCGLKIVHQLDNFTVSGLPDNMATVAVTNMSQEARGIGQRLVDAGYELVGRFTGNYSSALNLYLRQRIPAPPKKQAPGWYSRFTDRPVTTRWAEKNITRAYYVKE